MTNDLKPDWQEAYDSCPECDSKESEEYGEEFDWVEAKYIKYRKCVKCGHVFEEGKNSE